MMIELETFEYRHDDVALCGHIALPTGPGPHPALLIMRGAAGVSAGAERRAQRLADAGYVALVTDM
jgi:dienelactone hydrolase